MSNEVFKACGCVMFYMIHDNQTKICGLDKFYCAESVKENFSKQREDFKCYEPCNKVTYEISREFDERFD